MKTIISRANREILVNDSLEALQTYGLILNQRILTDQGMATVLGVCDKNYLWFQLDSESKASYWDDIKDHSSLLVHCPNFIEINDTKAKYEATMDSLRKKTHKPTLEDISLTIKAIELIPDNTNDYITQTYWLILDKHFELLQQFIQANPRNLTAYHLQFYFHMQRNELKAATTLLIRLTLLNPSYAYQLIASMQLTLEKHNDFSNIITEKIERFTKEIPQIIDTKKRNDLNNNLTSAYYLYGLMQMYMTCTSGDWTYNASMQIFVFRRSDLEKIKHIIDSLNKVLVYKHDPFIYYCLAYLHFQINQDKEFEENLNFAIREADIYLNKNQANNLPLAEVKMLTGIYISNFYRYLSNKILDQQAFKNYIKALEIISLNPHACHKQIVINIDTKISIAELERNTYLAIVSSHRKGLPYLTQKLHEIVSKFKDECLKYGYQTNVIVPYKLPSLRSLAQYLLFKHPSLYKQAKALVVHITDNNICQDNQYNVILGLESEENKNDANSLPIYRYS